MFNLDHTMPKGNLDIDTLYTRIFNAVNILPGLNAL